MSEDEDGDDNEDEVAKPEDQHVKDDEFDSGDVDEDEYDTMPKY